MGTRSVTIVRDNEFNPPEPHKVVAMYRQYDGYLEGHGKDLLDFLTGFNVVNGLSADQGDKVANGMGCLAAQMVAHFKDGPGGLYLEPMREDSNYGTDYTYTITGSSTEPMRVEVRGYADLLFEGTLTEYADLIVRGAKQCDYADCSEPVYPNFDSMFCQTHQGEDT